MYSVYGLVDPRTQEVRYVGMAKDVHKRYAQHLLYPHRNNAKSKWLSDLKDAGLIPSLIILEPGIKETSIYERERYWIHHYLDQGSELTNIMHQRKQQIKPKIKTMQISAAPNESLPQDGDEVTIGTRQHSRTIKILRILRIYTCLDGSKCLVVQI